MTGIDGEEAENNGNKGTTSQYKFIDGNGSCRARCQIEHILFPLF